MATLGAREVVSPVPELDEAACANHPTPDVFFPEFGGGDARPARAICSGCPVRRDCLTFALDNAEPFGVWGGLSAEQRRKIRAGA